MSDIFLGSDLKEWCTFFNVNELYEKLFDIGAVTVNDIWLIYEDSELMNEIKAVSPKPLIFKRFENAKVKTDIFQELLLKVNTPKTVKETKKNVSDRKEIPSIDLLNENKEPNITSSASSSSNIQQTNENIKKYETNKADFFNSQEDYQYTNIKKYDDQGYINLSRSNERSNAFASKDSHKRKNNFDDEDRESNSNNRPKNTGGGTKQGPAGGSSKPKPKVRTVKADFYIFKDKDFLIDDSTIYTAPKVKGNEISIDLGRIMNGEDENIGFLKDIFINESDAVMQTPNGVYKKTTDLNSLLESINEKASMRYPYLVFYKQSKSSLAARKDKTASKKKDFVCLVHYNYDFLFEYMVQTINEASQYDFILSPYFYDNLDWNPLNKANSISLTTKIPNNYFIPYLLVVEDDNTRGLFYGREDIKEHKLQHPELYGEPPTANNDNTMNDSSI